MREIKFRVWDHFNNHMVTQDDTDRLDLILQIYELTPKLSYPMQYTGLKDKNDKEIYESDIVDWDNGRGFVFYYEGAFYHEYREKMDGKLIEVYRPSKRMWDIVEVIGNIYENPELLENE